MPKFLRKSVYWLVVAPAVMVAAVVLGRFVDHRTLTTILPSTMVAFSVLSIFPLISLTYAFRSMIAKESFLIILIILVNVIILFVLLFIVSMTLGQFP